MNKKDIFKYHEKYILCIQKPKLSIRDIENYWKVGFFYRFELDEIYPKDRTNVYRASILILCKGGIFHNQHVFGTSYFLEFDNNDILTWDEHDFFQDFELITESELRRRKIQSILDNPENELS